MIKLKSLLTESKHLSPEDFGKIFLNAYKTIFDTDDVTVVKTHSFAHGYAHSWNVVRISMKYRFNTFAILNRVVHYKFPPEEKDNLNSIEWDTMLKHAEKMTDQPTTMDDIRKKNPLLVYGAGVYHNLNPDNTQDFFEMNLIGEVMSAKTMLDLISKVKKIIDNNGTDAGGQDEVPDSPVPSKPELTPA